MARAGLALASWLALAACGPPGQTAQYRWSLNPTNAAEVDLKLAPGEVASVTFAASQPVRWDVHWHEGARTVVEQAGESALATLAVTGLRAPFTSVRWTHPGAPQAPIELRVFVEPAASVHGTAP